MNAGFAPAMARGAFATLAFFGVLVLILTGCTPAPAPADDEAPDAYHFVQDLWVLESISTLDNQNNDLDLTEQIVRHFADEEPAASIALSEDVTFSRYPELAARIIDAETGLDRGDVDARAR